MPSRSVTAAWRRRERDALTAMIPSKTMENLFRARIRAALFVVSFLGFSPDESLTLG
jgi:hypothetical protein